MDNTVRDCLLALEEANNGVLTPDIVVQEAMDADSPLHLYFEWRDDKAAIAYRIEQARRLIKTVKVSVTTEVYEIKVPMFVRDPDAKTHEQGYRNLVRVKSDSEKAHEVLVNEFARAQAALERAHNIAAFLEMESQVREVIDKIAYLYHRAVKADPDQLQH